MIAKTAGVVVFVTLALLCGYFFLAGFEFPGVTPWKLLTGGLGVLFLLLAFVIAVQRARP